MDKVLILQLLLNTNVLTLIKSISGIRGTLGGKSGENLTPNDIVAFTAGFAQIIKSRYASATIITGRDGRNSGLMVQSLVNATLIAIAIHSICLGLMVLVICGWYGYKCIGRRPHYDSFSGNGDHAPKSSWRGDGDCQS